MYYLYSQQHGATLFVVRRKWVAKYEVKQQVFLAFSGICSLARKEFCSFHRTLELHSRQLTSDFVAYSLCSHTFGLPTSKVNRKPNST